MVLGITSLSKFLGLLYPTALLYQLDPVFKVPIYYVVVVACFGEFCLCIFIGFFLDDVKAAWTIFGFAIAVLTYRAISFSSGVSYCPCLGNVADWWPWLGRHETPLLTTIAIWLLLTSAFQLVWRSRQA